MLFVSAFVVNGTIGTAIVAVPAAACGQLGGWLAGRHCSRLPAGPA